MLEVELESIPVEVKVPKKLFFSTCFLEILLHHVVEVSAGRKLETREPSTQLDSY